MNFRLLGIVMGACALMMLSNCESASADSTEGATLSSTSKIVFIRLDSLTSQYGALKEKSEALEARAAAADKGQNERVTAFQRDVQNLQRRMNSGQMAPKQMGIEQERLAGREQALMQEADRLRQELQLENLRLSAELEENLLAVLEEIQAEFGYDYILSYGAGTGVLMVNDAHDITPEVVKRINLIPMDGELDANKEEASEATEEEAPSEE